MADEAAVDKTEAGVPIVSTDPDIASLAADTMSKIGKAAAPAAPGAPATPAAPAQPKPAAVPSDVQPPGQEPAPKPAQPGPEDVDPDKLENLTAAREACKAMRVRLGEAQKQIDAFKAKPPDAERLTELIEQNKQLEQRLERIDFGNSERYKSEYLAPLQEARDELKTVAQEYGIDEATLATVMAAKPADRRTALREATDDDGAVEVLPQIRKVLKLQTTADAALQNFGETAKQMAAAEEREVAQTQTQLVNEAAERLKQTHFLLNPSTENPDWLPALMRGAMATLKGDAEPEQIAESALRAQLADPLLSMLSTSMAEIKKLQGQLQQYERGTAKIGSAPPATPAAPGAPDEPKSLEDLAAGTMARILANR